MLIELKEFDAAGVFAIRAEDVALVEPLNGGGCFVTLDWKDPPVRKRVRESYARVLELVNEALYDYEE